MRKFYWLVRCVTFLPTEVNCIIYSRVRTKNYNSKNQKSEVIPNIMNRFKIFMPQINRFLAMVVSKMNLSCILMALIKLTRNK